MKTNKMNMFGTETDFGASRPKPPPKQQWHGQAVHQKHAPGRPPPPRVTGGGLTGLLAGLFGPTNPMPPPPPLPPGVYDENADTGSDDGSDDGSDSGAPMGDGSMMGAYQEAIATDPYAIGQNLGLGTPDDVASSDDDSVVAGDIGCETNTKMRG